MITGDNAIYGDRRWFRLAAFGVIAVVQLDHIVRTDAQRTLNQLFRCLFVRALMCV